MRAHLELVTQLAAMHRPWKRTLAQKTPSRARAAGADRQRRTRTWQPVHRLSTGARLHHHSCQADLLTALLLTAGPLRLHRRTRAATYQQSAHCFAEGVLCGARRKGAALPSRRAAGRAGRQDFSESQAGSEFNSRM